MPSEIEFDQVLGYEAFALYSLEQKAVLKEQLVSSGLSIGQIDLLFFAEIGIIHSLVLDSRASDSLPSRRRLRCILDNDKDNFIKNLIAPMGPCNQSIVAAVIQLTQNHIQICEGQVFELVPVAGEQDELVPARAGIFLSGLGRFAHPTGRRILNDEDAAIQGARLGLDGIYGARNINRNGDALPASSRQRVQVNAQPAEPRAHAAQLAARNPYPFFPARVIPRDEVMPPAQEDQMGNPGFRP